jgi:hypothetical protein
MPLDVLIGLLNTGNKQSPISRMKLHFIDRRIETTDFMGQDADYRIKGHQRAW